MCDYFAGSQQGIALFQMTRNYFVPVPRALLCVFVCISNDLGGNRGKAQPSAISGAARYPLESAVPGEIAIMHFQVDNVIKIVIIAVLHCL